MKITKKQLTRFMAIYDQLTRKLKEDLSIYRDAAIKTMQEYDIKCFNLDDSKDLAELAELFFYHRIETFKEREIGEPAVDEVLKILNERR